MQTASRHFFTAGDTEYELTPIHGEADLALPDLRDFYRFWLGKKGDAPMPRREDMNPVELRRHLSWVSVIEVIDGGRDYQLRLIGSSLATAGGRDSTGKFFSQLPEDTGQKSLWFHICGAVAGTARPWLSSHTMHTHDRPLLHVDSVLAPLTGGGLPPDQVFQIMVRTVAVSRVE